MKEALNKNEIENILQELHNNIDISENALKNDTVECGRNQGLYKAIEIIASKVYLKSKDHLYD